MRRRQEQISEPERWWEPRLVLLIIITLLLSTLFPAFLLQDQGGQRLGLAGAFTWLAACTSSFLLTLLFLSAFLLPTGAQPEGEGHFPEDVSRLWREGLFLLRRYLRTALIPGDQGDQQEVVGLSQDTVDALQRFRAAMVDSHVALVLFKGPTYSRAIGPGYVRLRPGERISEVIDLRLHQRHQDVTVITRDGIPLKTSVSVTFRVRQPEARGPFPFERDAMFCLTNATSVGPNNDTKLWHERICPLAAEILVDEIGERPLDELFELADLTYSPLTDIQNNVEGSLRAQIQHLFECPAGHEPIELVSVGIKDLIPPDKLMDQRIELWKESWRPFKSRQQFEGKAEASEYLHAARARTQVEMIDKLGREMAMFDNPLDDRGWNEMVMLRIIAALENMTIDDEAHPQAVRKMMSLLAELNQWLQ